MKKSLKKFLILTQVLGFSALAASACTNNNAQTTTSTTPANSNDQNKEQAPVTQTIDPSSLQEPHQTLKEKAIVKTAEITNGIVDAAVGAAVQKLISKDPSHSDQYLSLGAEALNKAKTLIDNKKEQELVKAAEKQAEKEEKAQAEGEDGHQGLTDKVKGAIKGLLHHGDGDKGSKKP